MIKTTFFFDHMRAIRLLIASSGMAVAALLASNVAVAQEPLLTNRATEMRAAPDDASALVRALPEKTTVQQLERKGAWTRIQIPAAAVSSPTPATTTASAKNAGKNAGKSTDKSTDKAVPPETGWVRMMHLRGGVVVVESQTASSGGGFFTGFGRFLSGGSSKTSTKAQSATIGIRGLSPDELKTATPDGAALAKMNSFKAEKPEAERYAKEARLARADVPELDNLDTSGRRK